MNASFPITGDGILGTPFLRENHVIINIGKGEITTMTDKACTIPARSEMIIPIQVDEQESLDHQIVLVHAQEIGKNVLCVNVLNIIKNQQILINVINTTEEP